MFILLTSRGDIAGKFDLFRPHLVCKMWVELAHLVLKM